MELGDALRGKYDLKWGLKVGRYCVMGDSPPLVSHAFACLTSMPGMQGSDCFLPGHFSGLCLQQPALREKISLLNRKQASLLLAIKWWYPKRSVLSSNTTRTVCRYPS